MYAMNDSGLSPMSGQSKRANSAAYRLERTRQRLGSYRHDLLVALRVVNSIEREVVRAEWERWVQQESRRCRMIDTVLKDRGSRSDKESVDEIKHRLSGREEDIEDWYKDYCLSCEQERKKMADISG